MEAADKLIHQLPLPKSLHCDALLSYHDSQAVDGHLGAGRVYGALWLKYYWTGMYQNVYGYIKSCQKCQVSKVSWHSNKATLHPLHITETFQWYHIDSWTVDGDTPDAHKHILLVLDSHSRGLRHSLLNPRKTQKWPLFCIRRYFAVMVLQGPLSLTKNLTSHLSFLVLCVKSFRSPSFYE